MGNNERKTFFVILVAILLLFAFPIMPASKFEVGLAEESGYDADILLPSGGTRICLLFTKLD
jgi:hypothetical protein